MAITQPVPITAAPPVPDSSVAEPTFDAQYENFNKWEATELVPGANALAENVHENAQEVVFLSGSAASAAQTATAEADLAMGYRNTAGSHATNAATSAGTALGYRDQSSGFADAAGAQAAVAIAASQVAATARDQTLAMGAQVLTASSTTSLAIGTGSKSLTVEAGRAFGPGMRLVLASAADPAAAQMQGQVTSYDRATGALVMSITSATGTGSRSDWLIAVGGGDSGSLPVVVITANTAGMANRCYVIAAAGITLTLPSAWTAGDRFAVREAIGAATYVLDFGATPLRSVAVGSTTVPAAYAGADFFYLDSTRGLI